MLQIHSFCYWYWYWYCNLGSSNIDIDIEIPFPLSHSPECKVSYHTSGETEEVGNLNSLELTSKLDYDVGFTLPIIHGILQYLNRQRFPPCQNQLTTLASSQSHPPCRSWHLPIQDMSCNTRLKFHLSHKVMNKLEAFFGHIEMVLSWRKFLFVTKSNIGHIGPNVKRST